MGGQTDQAFHIKHIHFDMLPKQTCLIPMRTWTDIRTRIITENLQTKLGRGICVAQDWMFSNERMSSIATMTV